MFHNSCFEYPVRSPAGGTMREAFRRWSLADRNRLLGIRLWSVCPPLESQSCLLLGFLYVNNHHHILSPPSLGCQASLTVLSWNTRKPWARISFSPLKLLIRWFGYKNAKPNKQIHSYFLRIHIYTYIHSYFLSVTASKLLKSCQ